MTRADAAMRSPTRLRGSAPLVLVLAAALVGLFARDLWSADNGPARALAALGVLAGLCGVLAALRMGRRSRPALVPPAEPPLAFEPVARPAAPAERRPAQERAPTTVLVIDGHDETRELLARGLAREGVHVITAADWEQGLRRARDVGPDLITLDALLPETDAWAMLRALKEDALTAQIPVIMTTLQSERGAGEGTAAFDYLPLPFDPERLSSALRRYWPRHGDATVLVVAGDAALRNGLAELLGAQGWMVLEAESSRLGLQLLAGALPDVVVLELDAAGAQGPEFLAALRGQPAWSAIPVVAVGLQEPSVEERQALEGRAPRVFQKSALSSHELARQIRGLLGRGSPPARRADAS